jgi:hypothetical protein
MMARLSPKEIGVVGSRNSNRGGTAHRVSGDKIDKGNISCHDPSHLEQLKRLLIMLVLLSQGTIAARL